MGNLHETMARITCEKWCEENGVTTDALRVAFPKIGLDNFAKVRTLSPDEVARISAYPFRKKNTGDKPKSAAKQPAKKSHDSQTVSPSPDKAQEAPGRGFSWPRFSINDFLALAIYGHTALVWYEVATIFALPGFLAGVVLFAMKHTATTLVKDEKRNAIHSDVLGVAFVLDALAVFPHYTVFIEALPDRYAQQMGTEGTFWAALILAIVVAAGAFLSMYFIKAITNSKMFD